MCPVWNIRDLKKYLGNNPKHMDKKSTSQATEMRLSSPIYVHCRRSLDDPVLKLIQIPLSFRVA